MDNQDSSPALIFPNVPDDFCPTGNWQNVFQEFIDEVLTNGTINVPGLGDVTPEEINQINQELDILTEQVLALQNDVAALENQVNLLAAVRVRRGVITSIPVGDSIQTVSFTALPNTNYSAQVTPFCNATIGASATPLFAIVEASKTITGFSIRIENNISQITQMDWVAIHSA